MLDQKSVPSSKASMFLGIFLFVLSVALTISLFTNAYETYFFSNLPNADKICVILSVFAFALPLYTTIISYFISGGIALVSKKVKIRKIKLNFRDNPKGKLIKTKYILEMRVITGYIISILQLAILVFNTYTLYKIIFIEGVQTIGWVMVLIGIGETILFGTYAFVTAQKSQILIEKKNYEQE